MTSRCGFLKLFGATVATATGVMVLDPEAALWRPGAKLISIPAPRPPSFVRYVSADRPGLGQIRRPAFYSAQDLQREYGWRGLGDRVRLGETFFVSRPVRFVPNGSWVPMPLDYFTRVA
jgi:hypothetical protein